MFSGYKRGPKHANGLSDFPFSGVQDLYLDYQAPCCRSHPLGTTDEYSMVRNEVQCFLSCQVKYCLFCPSVEHSNPTGESLELVS